MQSVRKPLLLILLILFSGTCSYSQTKEDFALKRGLTPLLDSLVEPPSNTDEAWGLMIYDSSENRFDYITLIEDQGNMIQTTTGDINLILKNPVNRSQDHQRGPGNGPPQGMPRSGMKAPDDLSDLGDDIGDANIVLDKMTVLTEKFKNEIKSLQNVTNEKLHATLESDHDAHVGIINDFMASVSTLYRQYERSYREYMEKLDDIVRKYDYGSNIKFFPVKAAILKLQLAQLNNLSFLLNITKELSSIGAKFHEEKESSLN